MRGGGGHLKPLDPTPLPNPIWPNWNRNDYFAFHQQIVLKTNSCLMLKHEVQDLIDSPSHNLKKWASEKQARMNKGMCLRDLIHVKTFARGWAISTLLSLFQLSCLQFIESIWVFLNVVLLSLSLIFLLSYVPFSFQINVISLSIKMAIQIWRVSCDLFN